MYKFLLSITLGFFSIIYGFEISEKGYWIGDASDYHVTDQKLSDAMVHFFKNDKTKSIVDFGCGEGEYILNFLKHGLKCEGYDGNPSTPEITNGLCKIKDLSKPFYLEKKFDWVVSLEVGEHLPHQYETIFIENLINHAKKGIILSWAVKGQGGTGHFNEQNNDYIKNIFSKYGFINDLVTENFLRDQASVGWFKNTIMVFRRKK